MSIDGSFNAKCRAVTARKNARTRLESRAVRFSKQGVVQRRDFSSSTVRGVGSTSAARGYGVPSREKRRKSERGRAERRIATPETSGSRATTRHGVPFVFTAARSFALNEAHRTSALRGEPHEPRSPSNRETSSPFIMRKGERETRNAERKRHVRGTGAEVLSRFREGEGERNGKRERRAFSIPTGDSTSGRNVTVWPYNRITAG